MSDATPEASKRRSGPLWEMLFIAAPTVVTMTSYTVMQFVDGMMVSRIGPEEVYVAAQGNGGMLVWVPVAFAIGLFNVVNTYVSQNLGAGRPERGAAYGWNALWMAGLAALLMVPYAIALPWIFRMLGHDGELLRLETAYAQIMAGGVFFTMAARGISHYFYGMHRPMVVMIAALAGNVVNVCANAILIFGAEGPPAGTPLASLFQTVAEFGGVEAMGVRGAAFGTVLGGAVELAFPIALFLSPAMNRRFATRAAWRPSLKHWADVWRLGWPGAVMFCNEMICWGYLMTRLLFAAGKAAGEDPEIHNAAGWIALRYMHVSFMPAVGISIAVSAMVGRCMGMRRPDLAAQRAWLGLKLTLAYMGACAVAFVVFREQLIGVFVPGDMPPEKVAELVAIGSTIMIAAAVFQLFDAMAINMSGALRGAGDTIWPGVVTVVLSWTFVVGAGHLLIAVAPSLGSLGPWIGAAMYIVILGILLVARFIGGKWRTIVLIGDDAAQAQTPTEDAVAGATPGAV